MGALVTGAAVVVASTAVVVAGAAVVVAGATVAVLGATVVELGAAGTRQVCQQPLNFNSKALDMQQTLTQNHAGLGPRHTPAVVVPGGRVLFALASSTAVGLVVVGAAVVVMGAVVVVAGDAVAGAAAGKPECLCQQRPASLEVAASELRSLASSR